MAAEQGPFNVAKDANNRVNEMLAEEDSGIASMSFDGPIGYHINVATGTTDPGALWKVALLQALDETVFEMTHVSGSTPTAAREDIERELREHFDHFTAELVADSFEENLRNLVDRQQDIGGDA